MDLKLVSGEHNHWAKTATTVADVLFFLLLLLLLSYDTVL